MIGGAYINICSELADNPDTTVDESETKCEDITKCFW